MDNEEKRAKALGITVVLSLIFICVFGACSQTSSQQDFFGVWVHESNDLRKSKMEYTITATTFTSLFTDTSPFTPRKTVFEIFSWEKIANEDAATEENYPSGFILGLRSQLGNATARLFIHRNKSSLFEAGESQNIYIKQ
jgi:hypothetical protein